MTFELSKQQSQIIKAFAIVFVIMSHTGVFPCGGAIGVHLFLIVSGYGIYCSLERSTDGFWKKRLASVYFPYLFCTVCFLIIRLVVYKNIDLIQILVSLLGQDFNLNADASMWYISYIFVCYLIAWIFFKTKDKNRKLATVLLITGFGVITACGYMYIIWHRGTIVWCYGLSFPFGMFLAKYRTLDLSKAKKLKIALLVVAISVFVLLLPQPHEKFVKFFFTLFTSIMIYTIITVPISNENTIINKILSTVGKKSYFMYLNEALVIGLYSLPGGVLLNTAIIVVSSFTLAWVMELLYNHLTKLRFYGKYNQ